jgi:hypothetical protein
MGRDETFGQRRRLSPIQLGGLWPSRLPLTGARRQLEALASRGGHDVPGSITPIVTMTATQPRTGAGERQHGRPLAGICHPPRPAGGLPSGRRDTVPVRRVRPGMRIRHR